VQDPVNTGDRISSNPDGAIAIETNVNAAVTSDTSTLPG
jgi:hypothetical protein